MYYNEPLEEDSPLRSLPNVYALPHQAGPTIDRRPIITKRLMDNLMLFKDGKEMPLEIKKDIAARMTVGG